MEEKWITKVSEMKGMARAGDDTLKRFFDTFVDTYRKPSGHEATDYPRQGVLFGSTNDDLFLRDLTGNSRCQRQRLPA